MLGAKHIAFLVVGSLVVSLAVFLLVVQVAYSFDAYWLFEWDFGILLLVMACLGATLLVIFSRSAVSTRVKIIMGLLSLVVFFGAAILCGLLVSCSNGDCL